MEDARKYSTGSSEIELDDIQHEIATEIEEEMKTETIEKIINDIIEDSMKEPIDNIIEKNVDIVIPVFYPEETNKNVITRYLIGMNNCDINTYVGKIYLMLILHIILIIISSTIVRDNSSVSNFVKENGVVFILSAIFSIFIPIIPNIKKIEIIKPYDHLSYLLFTLTSSYCFSITGSYDSFIIILAGLISMLILFTGNYFYCFNSKPLPTFSTQLMWLALISMFCFPIAGVYYSISFGYITLSLIVVMFYEMVLFGNKQLLLHNCEENTSISIFTLRLYSNSIYVLIQLFYELYNYMVEHLPFIKS